MTLTLDQLLDRFHATFLASERTALVGGFDEPIYLPARDGVPAEIRFTKDYFRSALHEVAHWCIAGKERRREVDYGYWYRPDGRNEEEQLEFFRVEARPQAVEWMFSLACDVRFRISLDNVGADLDPSDFIAALREEFRAISSAMPPRAARFLAALSEGRELDPKALYQVHHDDDVW